MSEMSASMDARLSLSEGSTDPDLDLIDVRPV